MTTTLATSTTIKELYPEVSITTINPTDKELLQKTVCQMHPNSINYENSWGYVVQATRYGGFRWYDPKTNSLVFFGRKSKTDRTLVVPTFFATPAYLTGVVQTIQQELQVSKTILKNIVPKEIINFIPYGFRRYGENEGWCKDARFDDQTYPQLIVDLKKATEAKGKFYHHLRKALRKNSNSTIRKYREADKKAVLAIFAAKDGNPKDKSKGMYFASHQMYPTTDMDKFVIINNNTKKIIGFTATSNISPKNIAFVALLFKPSVKIASVWGIYQTMAIQYHRGFKKINFGGCETEGASIFVRRTFHPEKKLKKTHLVYDGKT